ncbi:MAG TPA: acyclic terpene utilization AtuA family protein [Ktedonobacteraceae bacterium]|nr:acyclic terpene utilization AtuA family protein [Ktedonobacteraceae bacterium]
MKSVRIAGGLGFYGDSWQPIKASIERGNVRYVASDHLAELTLAILQKDRLRDPNLGYTRDLVPMLADLLPLALPRGVKFILNAGGLNPMAARETLLAALKKFGVKLKVGVVLGDSVLERLDELQAMGVSLAHMDTGEDIATVRERLLFASAYLGARPLVEALDAGADIVLTGRVADAALFLAPMMHEFRWQWDDWDKLAQGIVVGHLMECSGQATGGNFGGDWRSIPDLAHIGYPIAEVYENGDAIISKAPGTGGCVNFDTLREQLFYEVHDPAHYLTPDVDVDMTTLHMEEIGPDQVRVSGATGRPAPATLKIVAGYEDGYMGQAMLGYAWPDALAKAQLAAEIVQQQMKEQGLRTEETLVEFIGYNSIHGPLADPAYAENLNEVYLRIAVRCKDKREAARLGRLLTPLGLSGPPFIGGAGGIMEPRGLLGIWPTLAPRGVIEEYVRVSVEEAGV